MSIAGCCFGYQCIGSLTIRAFRFSIKKKKPLNLKRRTPSPCPGHLNLHSDRPDNRPQVFAGGSKI